MMSSVDITYHVTCLDMQLTMVAFNSELTMVWHAQASHYHVGADGVCACKKEVVPKTVTCQKCSVYP